MDGEPVEHIKHIGGDMEEDNCNINSLSPSAASPSSPIDLIGVSCRLLSLTSPDCSLAPEWTKQPGYYRLECMQHL